MYEQERKSYLDDLLQRGGEIIHDLHGRAQADDLCVQLIKERSQYLPIQY